MRYDRLDLNLLVALDTLLREASVTQAAQRMNVTQPAMSAALNRLREYFNDPLLVQHGRKMFVTPRAKQLAPSVARALTLIRSEITQPNHFDPATSQRKFVVVVSDYVYSILLADVLAEISDRAPNLRFEIHLPSSEARVRFENFEVDIYITVRQFAVQGHPCLNLFCDDDVIATWRHSDYPEVIDRETFLNARQVGVVFGTDQKPSFSEWHIGLLFDRPRVELTVPSFVAVAKTLVGTQRLATMHRKLAEELMAIYPIRIHPMPIDLPVIEEVVQSHRLAEGDEAIAWIIAQMQSIAKQKNLTDVVEPASRGGMD